MPFDYTQAGPQLGNGDAKRSETTVRLAKEIVRLAEKPVPADRRAYPAPPPPPPPVAIVDNFEDDLNLSVK